MEHSEIIAWAIEGTPGLNSVPMNHSHRELAGLKSASVLPQTPAATKIEPAKLAARNLRMMRTFRFGIRAFH
jgi:hypothetical protein